MKGPYHQIPSLDGLSCRVTSYVAMFMSLMKFTGWPVGTGLGKACRYHIIGYDLGLVSITAFLTIVGMG